MGSVLQQSQPIRKLSVVTGQHFASVLLTSAFVILVSFDVFHYITCVCYVFPLHLTGEGDKGGGCDTSCSLSAVLLVLGCRVFRRWVVCAVVLSESRKNFVFYSHIPLFDCRELCPLFSVQAVFSSAAAFNSCAHTLPLTFRSYWP